MKAPAGDRICEETYYEILGIEEDATTPEIRAAWRSLISHIHPDREADEAAKEAANEQAALINAAYTTLASEPRRAEYDARLRVKREEEREPQPGRADGDRDPFHEESHEPEDSDWDWIDEQGEDQEREAEAAWAEWEKNANAEPRENIDTSDWRTIRDRQTFDGMKDDYAEANEDLARCSPSKDLIFNAKTWHYAMICVTVGYAHIFGLLLAGAGSAILVVMGLALALDYVITVAGARPLRMVAAHAGAPVIFSEGQRDAAYLTLGLRTIWAGPVLFTIALLPVWIGSLIFNAAAGGSNLDVYIGYGLYAFAPVWTLILIVVSIISAAKDRA